jgi:hypothetical protein
MAVLVVNTIPNTLSNESIRDGEPNVAVNPANPLEIAFSAFTPDPMNSGNAPIFVSTDGGNTWALNVVLPGGNKTNDTTIRFGTISNVLYAGILRTDNSNMNLLRKAGFTTAGLMTVLVNRANEDQPYTEAATVLGGGGAGLDRVYVGHNDFNAAAGRTATVEASLNAATAAPPAGFVSDRLEVRATSGQDGPPIRPAIHPNGTVYAVFLGWRSIGSGGTINSDVVVVRDDVWASGPTPFTALLDSGDGLAGQRVAAVTLPSFGSLLGTQRVGSQMAIAVDPRNSATVYIAWADGATAANYTIHLRRSVDGGQTWTGDLRTITPATNPGLAINVRGKVAFLYQRLNNPGSGNRWETHVELSNDGFATAPTDLTLANVPDQNGTYAASNPIGDYAGLVSLGKHFYGAFSANNTPIAGNFPQGVTYLRNVNWATNTLLGTDGMTAVSVSIDPFFFKITDIEAADDFYVRDWTDSPSNGDNGLEPSTHPVFYATSDVWNRRGTLPGAFPNDQPENEDAGNGMGIIGDNWAFARVRRNVVAASGSVVVTAHFLVSKLGVGSNYADAGSVDPNVSFPDPDPTVTFNPADVGPFVTPAYHWHLNAVSSTHLCLAVEISTPGDPFVGPSLVGNAPGWPTTDLRVINDNNKAQRNMGLSTTPARGADASDVFYAIIHNAATIVRDMTLRIEIDRRVLERLKRARIRIVGGRDVALKLGSIITAPRMQPGENRWIGLTFSAPKGKEGDILPIHVLELVNGTVVNGFGAGARLGSIRQVIEDALKRHRSLLARLSAGFNFEGADDELAALEKLSRYGRISEAQYVRFVREQGPFLVSAVKRMLALERSGDPFKLAQALRTLAGYVGRRAAGDIAVAHSALLNAFDAYLTMLQLSNGDPADVLQTVRWQQRLFTVVPVLARVKSTPVLLEQSDRFIREYGQHRISNREYSVWVGGLMGVYEDVARARALRRLRLERDIREMVRSRGEIAPMQKAHRGFLLKLQKLDRSSRTRD